MFSSLQGSRDNMSIVLVVFPGAPKPTEEAIQADKELNIAIERRIKGSVAFVFLNLPFLLFSCYYFLVVNDFFFVFFFLEIYETTEDVQFADVVMTLQQLNIEGLPPGGGLAAK